MIKGYTFVVTDERRDGRPEHDEDETVQSEAPEAEAVPRIGAPPLRLHVGRQPLGQRAHTHLHSRHAHARRLQSLQQDQSRQPRIQQRKSAQPLQGKRQLQ